MCGIAGILRVHAPGAAVGPPEEAIPGAWLDALDESIRHRGPDGHGRFRDRVARRDGCVLDVAFVHRRLSIIDHAGGGQPMIAPAGVPGAADLLSVVFNGCIYNHRALRRELAALGHVFATDHSDTEVLLHGWRAWRESLFDRADGMYAAALWDRAAGTLALARDTHGEKPLHLAHFALRGGWINAFGSVPPAGVLAGLLPAHAQPCQTDAPADAWLRFGWGRSAPRAGARAVSPGTVVVYGPAQDPISPGPNVRTRTSRAAPQGHAPTVRDLDLTPQRLDGLLRAAVESRLEADVPLGCFLSGGVDSSLVAWYAKQAAGRVRTFTVRMPDAAYDESAFAQAAARAIGADHTTVECQAEPARDLCVLVRTMRLPLGDSSLLPAYWVCRAARTHVTVALSGDGGDELFGGYERYGAAAGFRWTVPLAGALGRVLRRGAHPKSRRDKAGRWLDAAANLGYYDLVSVFPDSMLRELIADAGAPLRRRLRSAPVTTRRDAMEFDLRNYLPDDLLTKTDAASMQVALEVRCPLLAEELVAEVRRATLESLLPGGERKGLLRAVARQYLPREIVDRPKMGFAIPIGEWFRTGYGGMKDLLLARLRGNEPFPREVLGLSINRSYVDHLVAEHLGNRIDHGQRLYALLVMSLWAQGRTG